MTDMLVRVKPYNPKRGQLARRVTINEVRFDVERGWYKVDAEFAAMLKRETLGGDPNGPLVFDVCTPEEAQEIQRREDQAAEAARAEKPIVPEVVTPKRRSSTDSGTLTTVDLATKSATPIIADGADPEDELDQDAEDDADGRVLAVGRMPEDKPAPKSRTRSKA